MNNHSHTFNTPTGMLKTYRMLHEQADGLCREVASTLPSVKKLTESYTDRLENWESRVVKRDFSYKQQGSSRKVWKDARESSEKEQAKKEKRASTSRKSRRKSILFGSKPVVVRVWLCSNRISHTVSLTNIIH